MGYSCAVKAASTLEAIGKICVSQTGTQNVYIHKGRKYFWEMSRRETPEGSINGKIYEFVSENSVIPKGSFKISETGKILKWTAKPVKWNSVHERFNELKKHIFGNSSFALMSDNDLIQKEYDLYLPIILHERQLGI